MSSNSFMNKKLQDIVREIGDGGTPPRGNSKNFGGDIPWVVVDDIQWDIKETKERLSSQGIRSSSAKLWQPGTIILSTGATIGKVGIARTPLCTKQGIHGIVCKQEVALPEYVAYFLEYSHGKLNSLAQGSTIKEVRAKQILSLEIPVPPLAEQKKIVDILSVMDRRLVSLRSKKEKIRLAKSALSLQVFRSPDNSDAKSFDTADLQSLATMPISYGVLVPDSATRDTGVLMIKIQDIDQGIIQTQKLSYISKELHQKYRKTETRSGDILISLIGSIGITAKVTDALDGANVSRQFAVIRTSDREISDYLHCFLGGAVAQEKISYLSQGNAQKALNLDSLRGLEVPLRSREEMKKITSFFRAFDSTIGSLSKTIEKTEVIRKSVSFDFFSGRKRVSV